MNKLWKHFAVVWFGLIVPVVIGITIFLAITGSDDPKKVNTNAPDQESTATTVITTTTTAIPSTEIHILSQQVGSEGNAAIYHFTIDGVDCIKYSNDPVLCKGYGR